MKLNLNNWLIFSGGCVVVYLIIIFGMRPVWGIDFLGGSLLEVQGSQLTTTNVRDTLKSTEHLEVAASPTQTGSLLLRTSPLNPEQHTAVLDQLKKLDPKTEELRFESIGPTIGAELRQKAWMAVSLSVLIMIAYLAYEFRRTSSFISSWKFGLAAAGALIHDLLFVTALFVILGHKFGVALDTLFVTAMLALGGYSVNDTIVLFNRLKLEWLATRSRDLSELINHSINLTLLRSINTTVTILLVLIALLLFGGDTIRWFIVALTAGTLVGAYSTIFVAPPLLYLIARKK